MHAESGATTRQQYPAQPAWLAGSQPAVQDLYLYWADCSAGYALPRRGDIDFATLAEALPGVLLAELNPARRAADDSTYLYRSIAELGDLAIPLQPGEGFDPSLFQHIRVSGCLAAAFQQGPVSDRLGLVTGDGVPLDYEVVFLPLAPDAPSASGQAVDSILILAVELPIHQGGY
jgi:hypothetical protein